MYIKRLFKGLIIALIFGVALPAFAAYVYSQGGTNNTSYSLGGFIYDAGSQFKASSSPTVGWITATSTTAINQFNGVITANNQITSSAGSASTPSYSFVSPNGSTGIYLPSISTLGFATGGTQRANLSSAGLIFNSIPITTFSAALGNNGNASAPTYSFNSAPNYGMYYTGSTLNISANGSDAITIDSSGLISLNNVALGLTTLGSSAQTDGSGFSIKNNGGSTNLFRIDETGNVGIGTSSPYAKLSVVGQIVGTYFTATSTTATSTFNGPFSIGPGLVTQTPLLNTADIFGDYGTGANLASPAPQNTSGLNVTLPGGDATNYAVIKGRRVLPVAATLTSPANSNGFIFLSDQGVWRFDTTNSPTSHEDLFAATHTNGTVFDYYSGGFTPPIGLSPKAITFGNQIASGLYANIDSSLTNSNFMYFSSYAGFGFKFGNNGQNPAIERIGLYGGSSDGASLVINGTIPGNVALAGAALVVNAFGSENSALFANNVGIGTTTPLSKLNVFGSNSDAQTYNAFTTFQTVADRSDATLSLGYVFTPIIDLSVSSLGRLYYTGNVQNHTVYIYRNDTQALVTSGVVLAASASDGNNYKYVSVTPVTLSAGTTYSIVSAETNGGDTWKDVWDTTNDFSKFIKRTGSAYGSVGNYPGTQSSGVNIYNTPTMKFTAEQASQEQLAYNTNNTLDIYMRSNGNAAFAVSNPDKFVGFSGLSVGKTQGTAGVTLDVAGNQTITGPAPQLTLTDGQAPLYLGANGSCGAGNCFRWGGSGLIMSSAGTMWLNLDSGSTIYANTQITLQNNATLTAAGLIQAANGTAGAPSLTFQNDTNTGWWGTGSDVLAASTGGTERLRIDSSGNVGIGTTSPYATTSIQSNSSTGDAFVVATSSKAAIGGYDNDGHRFTSGPPPAISSCGTGTGTVVGDDQSGDITTATAATACTATFSKAYRKAPVCTVSDNSLVGFADVSSVSVSAVTFGISSALTGGHLYYQCSYHQ